MGWLVVFPVLLLIGFLPIGLHAAYDENGAVVRLIAGPIRLTVFPKSEKTKSNNNQGKPVNASGKAEKKGGNYKEFIPLLHLALDLLVDLRRKIRVDNLWFKLVLAGEDPCDLAVNYGRAWIALGNLLPQLERVFTIKKRNLEVECDFVADATTVLFQMDITITVARLLHLGFKHGIRIIREYLKVMNNRKGGAKV